MVRAADELTAPMAKLATSTVSVNLTGDSALRSDFSKVNHSAMIRSEVLSWPVTMIVLVLAFGSLAAAGLPLIPPGESSSPAAGVMVAVLLTFALSGPLAPKEMGIVLAVAVFLDALCVRLIVLPVVLRLTGHAAWHTPRWLAKILPEVRFPH